MHMLSSQLWFESIAISFKKTLTVPQEVLFYEDGEPTVDGEAGDLKVWFFSMVFNKFNVAVLLPPNQTPKLWAGDR